ncbi:DNA-binding protein HU-beta [Candidatus Termititenax persephonae]|uniref:DNA-binding protein HU-beta n=1 Tax=Candidatus Termititenax persephonae TaxID=2218525 RepID=A0A388TEG9_9BACT|nr:DNA-binding protein HU-beta [Candidatus Termititenax persephonae]
MNQKELAGQVAKQLNLNKVEVEEILDCFLRNIITALAAGEKIRLVGFGIFEAHTRAGREGRNPQTGEKIFIPETRTPAFISGRVLKDAVRHKNADT